MTNEDFRKLMMTPRAPAGGGTSAHSTTAATPAFAKPRVP